MPRQKAATFEDTLTRCPHCTGVGYRWKTEDGTREDCVICTGTGRITNKAAFAYKQAKLSGATFT